MTEYGEHIVPVYRRRNIRMNDYATILVGPAGGRSVGPAGAACADTSRLSTAGSSASAPIAACPATTRATRSCGSSGRAPAWATTRWSDDHQVGQDPIRS